MPPPPLKVRLEEHQKVAERDKIKKSGMADYIKKGKRNTLSLWDEFRIIYIEEHQGIRRLNEAVYVLSYRDEMNMIWEAIIKKACWKKNYNMI